MVGRLNLNDWFKRHTSRPLLVGHGLIIVVCALLMGMLLRSDQALIDTAIDDFVQVAPRAISQQNRPMLESLLLSFGRRVNAISVGICEGERELISLMEGGTFCSTGHVQVPFMHRVQKLLIPGSTEHQVYFVVPRFSRLKELIFIFIAALTFVALNLIILRNVGQAIWRDVILPIRESRIDHVRIGEVHDLLQSKEESERLRTEIAVSKARRDVANRVAHDIRSPLSALSILVQRASGLTSEQKELLEGVAKRINGIAEDVLQKERYHNTKPALPVRLADAIHDVAAEKKIQYGDLIGLEILVDADIFAMADPQALKRALSNLVNNSMEAMGGHGKVLISTTSEGPYVTVSVRDMGPGIQPDVLSTIGKKKISTKNTGHGIGLMGIFSDVEAWGGKVRISSEPGHGTEVLLVLNRSSPNTH